VVAAGGGGFGASVRRKPCSAVRDFGTANARLGSFATEAVGATPRSMSALPRKRTIGSTFQ
jgi:hypothetical protein